MDIETAVQILEMHNKWRRGADIEPSGPSVIGEAIDTVVNYYTMQKIDEVASAPNNPWRKIKDKDAWLAQIRGYEVTSCCHVEPPPSKNYCPKCGAKIERDEEK